MRAKPIDRNVITKELEEELKKSGKWTECLPDPKLSGGATPGYSKAQKFGYMRQAERESWKVYRKANKKNK